jgi:hypothetical protein
MSALDLLDEMKRTSGLEGLGGDEGEGEREGAGEDGESEVIDDSRLELFQNQGTVYIFFYTK